MTAPDPDEFVPEFDTTPDLRERIARAIEAEHDRRMQGETLLMGRNYVTGGFDGLTAAARIARETK